MKVQLTSHAGPKPEPAGTAWLEDGEVHFSDPVTRDFCIQVAFDQHGPVPVEEAERFLRSLPLSISGGLFRAELT